jgi:lysozyme
MRISDEGLQALERRENPPPDFSPCLKAYLDGKNGTWTIGTGHTGPEVHEGLEWTPEQCRDALRKNLIATEACIQSTVKPEILAQLTQNEYDALVSFVFWSGSGNWRTSGVLRALNAGKLDQVPAEMARWKYANGDYSKPNQGVVNRRNSEIGQWSRGAFVVSSDAAQPSPPPSWWQQAHNRVKAIGSSAVIGSLSGAQLQDAGTKLQTLPWHRIAIVGAALFGVGIFWDWFRSRQ